MAEIQLEVRNQRYRDWAVAKLRKQFSKIGRMLNTKRTKMGHLPAGAHPWSERHRAQGQYYTQHLPHGPGYTW